MPTEPSPATLAEVVRHAVEVCELAGADDRLDDLLARFEDADEPVTAVVELDRRIAEATGALDPDGEDGLLAMTEAVILYLARRRDELDAPAEDVLRLAARAEFHGHPPEHVEAWLEQVGVRA
ncbi:MAG TPA: hypothetical protein VKV16_06360 [Solirubrobacteraceae bacterium]|nr:hypothetical protein [Solirubrobacteraceae bacterium]